MRDPIRSDAAAVLLGHEDAIVFLDARRGATQRRPARFSLEPAAYRDVQAADAATVWRLIEANQPQEAVTFLVARMHGRNVEDPIKASSGCDLRHWTVVARSPYAATWLRRPPPPS